MFMRKTEYLTISCFILIILSFYVNSYLAGSIKVISTFIVSIMIISFAMIFTIKRFDLYCYITFCLLICITKIVFQYDLTIGAIILHMLTFLSYLLLSSAMMDSEIDTLKVMRYLIIYYLLFLSYQFLMSLYNDLFFSFYINKIFADGSRNVVMQYLLFFWGGYLFLTTINNVKPSFIIGSLSFLFLILSGSRTAAALGVVFFGITLFYLPRRLKVLFALLIFLITMVGILYFSTLNLDLNLLIKGSNYSEGIDSPRSLMIDEFINNSEPTHFIFGSENNLYPTIDFFNNPHNSLISAVIRYGFPGFIFFGFVLFCMSTLLLVGWFPLAIGIVFYVRILIDSISFNGYPSDIIFFFVAFYAIRNIKGFSNEN